MTERIDRVASLLRELAAEFISTESNRESLITVTGATVSKNLAQATILVTVLPEEAQQRALTFLDRKREEFRSQLKKINLKRIPKISFAIDQGEKNRQLIDEIVSKS